MNWDNPNRDYSKESRENDDLADFDARPTQVQIEARRRIGHLLKDKPPYSVEELTNPDAQMRRDKEGQP